MRKRYFFPVFVVVDSLLFNVGGGVFVVFPWNRYTNMLVDSVWCLWDLLLNRVTVRARTHTWVCWLDGWLDRSRECASIRTYICLYVGTSMYVCVYVCVIVYCAQPTPPRTKNIMQYKRTFYMLRRIRSSVVTFATPKNIIRVMNGY